jgi:DNA-binding SARP family transcriptional activator
VEICLLGSLEVFDDDGGIVAIPGALVRTLLTALALRCGAVVSDDQLVDALWGENPPHRTANALQRQVSRLRVSLGAPDAVARRGSGYALKIDRSAVDVFRFDALAAQGHEAMRNGDAMRACELLAEALALWRGDALADVAYEEFAQPDIARLTAARLHATEVRIDAFYAREALKAVAQLLRVPVGTIRSRLFYAREALKDALEQLGAAFEGSRRSHAA